MNFQDILFVAHYECRMLKRNFAFILLCIIGIVGISVFHILAHSVWKVFPFQVDIPAAIPYTNAYLFCVFQSFALLFLGGSFFKRDQEKGTNDVFFARPVGNVEYILGKFLALVQLFLILAIVSGSIALLINFFASKAICNPWYYLFYFLTLTLPVTLFIAAFSVLVKVCIRNQALSLFLLLFFWGASILFLPNVQYGLFDFMASGVPNIFSGIVGHPALGSYLLQRLIYILFACLCLIGIVRMYPRASNSFMLPLKACRWGLFVFTISILFCWAYLNPFYQQNKARKNYTGIYKSYDATPKVSVRAHDITFRQEGTHYIASSLLEVENMNEERVDSLLFYLNPGLRVTRSRIAGDNRAFRQNEQVVVISYSLEPGETCSLILDYEGIPVSDICYLDIPDKIFYGLNRIDYFLNPGRCFLFLDAELTLMTPEALWYPTSVPVVNMTQPYLTVPDYTVYNLKVLNPSGRTIVSQGEEYSRGDTVCFTNDRPLVSISLVAGDLACERIESDSGRFECYYAKGKYLLQGVCDASEEGRKSGVERLWRFIPELTISREKYPFDKLVMVEHPLSYASFRRPWKSISNYACPEMYFFPEKKDRVKIDFNKVLVESMMDRTLPEMERELFFEKMRPFFITRFPKIPQEVFAVQSKDYPLMNGIISAFDWNPRLENKQRLRVADDMEVIEYLSGKSMREVIDDPDAFGIMNNMIRLKSEQLRDYILTQMTWDEFLNFMSDFIHKYRYRNVRLETLCAECQEKTGVDIFPWIDKCYNEKGVPSFVVKDVKTYFTVSGEETVIYLSFKIWNKGGADGVASMLKLDRFTPEAFFRSGNNMRVLHGNNSWKEWIFKSILVPSGRCLDICVIADTLALGRDDANNYLAMMGKMYWLTFNFSGNYPSNRGFQVSIDNRTLVESVNTGISSIDSSVFLPLPGTIIVDNEDPGFRITEEQLLFSRNLEKQKYSKRYPPLPRWTLFIDREAYGDVVQSYYCKGAGGGKAKIEWNASIEEAGTYELFIYYFWVSRDPIRWGNFPLHHYTFHHEGLVDNIYMNPNVQQNDVAVHYATGVKEEYKVDFYKLWIPVGKYTLAPGEVKLVLHDNGLSAGQILYADAVKWVKVE